MKAGAYTVRKWMFPLFAVLLALILTLGILELTAWALLHKKWERKPMVPSMEGIMLTAHGKRLKPNLELKLWHDETGHLVDFRSNSLGFRGKEISIPKPPGTIRVLVLGDSVTLQTALPEDETYTDLAGKILSASFKVEVINAAVTGVGLMEEIGILKENGLRVQPDVVLLGFYLNDSRPAWGFEKEYYKLSPRLIEFSKTIEQYSYLYKWIWKRLLARRYMRKDLASIWDWTRDYNQGGWKTSKADYLKVIQGAKLDFGSAWQEKSWDTIYSGLDELAGLGEKNNFKLMVLIFPATIQVKSEFGDDYPQQKMMAYCREHSVPCLDLLPIFRQHMNEDTHFDYCHMTALGNQLIAKPVAEFLEPELDGIGKNQQH